MRTSSARRPSAGAARPSSRTPQRAAPRPRLRVVPPPHPSPRRAPFVVVVLGLLVTGLATLLVLNTVLAQGAFRVEDLQRRVAVLADDEQALQQQVAELAGPGRLSHKARMLGMVPMIDPAFLRTSDGRTLGHAAPATGLVPQWARGVAPPPAPAASDPAASESTAAESAGANTNKPSKPKQSKADAGKPDNAKPDNAKPDNAKPGNGSGTNGSGSNGNGTGGGRG